MLQTMTPLEAALKEARQRGFGQGELAKRLGVSAGSLTAYKQMGELVRLRTARLITAILSEVNGCQYTVDELFPRGGAEHGKTG